MFFFSYNSLLNEKTLLNKLLKFQKRYYKKKASRNHKGLKMTFAVLLRVSFGIKKGSKLSAELEVKKWARLKSYNYKYEHC